ncbi:MAG: FKBP-type peptidyl-prolyl cis-trans isomerase [Phycisphaerales bacterium]|nr:FKBP-type peptidyl-prolyl cis-trans isomerase [Phycisphaerales bacterium]
MMKSFMAATACGVALLVGGVASGQAPVSVTDAVKPLAGEVDSANMPESQPAAAAQTPSDSQADSHTTASGLTIIDLGSKQVVAAKGDVAIVHYTGKLQATGEKFDSSRDRGRPFPVTLGEGSVIKGWEEGLLGMKLGDRRELIIPPDLGYGAEEKADQNGKVIIPANSTLIFDIEMVGLVKSMRP